MIRRLFVAAIASLAALMIAAPTQAGLLPIQVTISPDGGNFQWAYSIVLPTNSQLTAGNYFTIYDFGGLVPGTITAPTGWTSSVANVGPTPGMVNPVDNPNIPNLTFTYDGPTINTGQLGLGNFSAVSTYQNGTNSSLAAQTQRTSDGKGDQNITETTVPVPFSGGGGPPPVPEPTTLALAGLGLPVIALGRRLRRVCS